MAADDLHGGLQRLLQLKFTLISVKYAAEAVAASQKRKATGCASSMETSYTAGQGEQNGRSVDRAALTRIVRKDYKIFT